MDLRQNHAAESKVERAPTFISRLGLIGRYRRTRLGLVLERIAAPLLVPVFLVFLFLALAWAGLFSALEPMPRMAITLAMLAGFLASLWPLRTVSLPTSAEIAQRLDFTCPDAHRPLHSLADTLAHKNDAFATALWSVHQRRAEEKAQRLQVATSDAKLRYADPFALRWIAVLAVIVTAFMAGDERNARLALAFDWSTPRVPPVPPRLDIWIDPPAYTGRPPMFLTSGIVLAEGESTRAPVGSVITIRSTSAQGTKAVALALEHGAGLTDAPTSAAKAEDATATPKPEQPGITTLRRILRANSVLKVQRNGKNVAAYQLDVIPDLPPQAHLDAVRASPASAERQTPGGISLAFTLNDDYGLAKADLLIERIKQAPGARTLLPPPTTTLPLRLGEGEISLATEDHPWAGEEVSLRIRVEDDIGQFALSEAKTIMLPRRPFSQPLAKALVEQRKNLVFMPDHKQDVLLALDALLFEPEIFTPNTGEFLALDSIRAGIKTARHDDKLRDMVERIYDLALYIENGDMSEAERRLREAEARLRDALERDAPKDEIKRLAEDLRRAMDQFLREFVERALKEQNNQSGEDRPPSSTDRMLSQRDLQDMLRKIEEMARSGNMAEAQRMLNELKQMLENLRSARRQDVDPTMRELGRQIEELERMQREQRDLRDRTFRNGQQPNRQQGQRQQGQQNQQGQQKQGEPGDDAQSLQQQQQALRDRLKQLQERMKDAQDGLGDAQEGMGEAEGQLGQGKPGQATEGQQRALDGMGRAMQGMSDKLQQQMGEGEGGEPGGMGAGPSQRGRAENRSDPLGRNPQKQDKFSEETTKLQKPDGQANGSVSERADRVLRELRRRLGEFDRPRDELDYFERLLRQR